jgi:hypothetical protein
VFPFVVKSETEIERINAMGFFANLFQFKEGAYHMTQRALLDTAKFTPDVSKGYFKEHCEFTLQNGQHVSAGVFSMPSVADLRSCVEENLALLLDGAAGDKTNQEATSTESTTMTVQTIVGQARSLHSEFEGAVFQAASQFNFLEFPSSSTTPEAGIEVYKFDRTQGPACAIACAAGTAYRNYLVPVPFANIADVRQRGQVESAQLNGLQAVETYLVSEHLKEVPWFVKNGYIESNKPKLDALNKLLEEKPHVRDEIISRLSIGVQEDTTATDPLVQEGKHLLVTQTYNSAISIGYSMQPLNLWEPIARTILEATYEATLLVGLLKTIEARQNKKKRPSIFLTQVGGGVFQNKHSWIQAAIDRAVDKVSKYGIEMDIHVVRFGTR